MNKRTPGIVLFYVGADLALIALAFYLPYLVRYSENPYVRSYPLFQKWLRLGDWALGPYTLVFLIWAALSILFLQHYRLYRTDRSLSYLDETLLVARAVFLGSLAAAGAIFFLQVKIYSRLVFFLNAFSMFVFLASWRAFKRRVIRRRVRAGFNNRNVLIAGTGRPALAMAAAVERAPYLGLELVGFLDDGAGEAGPVLGSLAELETAARQRFVDELLIAVPPGDPRFAALVERGLRLGLGVKITPDVLGAGSERMRVSYLGDTPMLEYQAKGLHGADLLLKRGFDILVSGLGLVLLFPLLLLLAVLVRLDSPGPVFYVSERCGRKGKAFRFYKFRSMRPGAEEELEKLRHLNETDGPVFKIRRDPRVTRTGRLLRRLSLDELPQLWNILKGDMSLVGPRPPTPEEVAKYEDWQLRRLEIRPGLTCLWQIGGRSDLSFAEWMKLDLFYLDNWSFWLDLKIILKTVFVVLRGQGAY